MDIKAILMRGHNIEKDVKYEVSTYIFIEVKIIIMMMVGTVVVTENGQKFSQNYL